LKQLLLDIQPLAPPTLENFIIGKNAEALHKAAAKAIYWKPANKLQ
jgi:DnaA family protein